MRRSVILPARSFTWAWGRPAGGGLVPPQGLVLILKPHRTRKIPPCLRKRILGAQYGSLQLRKGVAGKGSSQTLLNDEEITPAYRPVVRRVSRYRANFAFAPPPPQPCAYGHHGSSRLAPEPCAACQTFGPFFRSKFWFHALFWAGLRGAVLCAGLGRRHLGPAARISPP